MFTKSARFYDALYRFKDYPGAADKVRALVQEQRPAARTLLDVACGTGRHLEALRQHFQVEGLDLNADLLEIARVRCPGVPLHHGDMTDFALEGRFDVVTCLFSSIGYVRTAENMRRAVAAMARHLLPGGLLLIEPWFTPEAFWVDHLVANYVDEPDLKISWMYVQRLRDRVSVLDIHYQVGTPQGIEQFRELHEMGLFSLEDQLDALREAGLEPEHDPNGFCGRGLLVGRNAGA